MRVLQYYHWGYFEPIIGGADVIAANQLEYFRRRGWDVDVLLMAHPDRDHNADAFQRRYPWLRSVRPIDMHEGDFTFRGKLFAHEQIARSDSFRALAREGHDLFLANYVFAAPLLEPLPGHCLKLLEALDIMTNSFALYRKQQTTEPDPMALACDAFLRNMEFELYRLFDAVLFINEEERRIVEPFCPGRTHGVPPMLPWELVPEQNTGKHAGPESISKDSFDLIFVGSNAYPNVRGLTFFYRTIFVPYLRKHKVRLAVIGKVCEILDFEDHYVTKLGNVPGDLREHYERSKVVIVPILEGSGLSIKTIECLANGRAVATSPIGARGTPPRSRCVPPARYDRRPARHRPIDSRTARFGAEAIAYATHGARVLSRVFRRRSILLRDGPGHGVARSSIGDRPCTSRRVNSLLTDVSGCFHHALAGSLRTSVKERSR